MLIVRISMLISVLAIKSARIMETHSVLVAWIINFVRGLRFALIFLKMVFVLMLPHVLLMVNQLVLAGSSIR